MFFLNLHTLVTLVCSLRPFRSAEKFIAPSFHKDAKHHGLLANRWCMEVWGPQKGPDPSRPRKFGHAARRESGGHGWGIHEILLMVKSQAAEAWPEPRNSRWWCRTWQWSRHETTTLQTNLCMVIMALGNGGNGNINKEGFFKQPCSMIHSHLRAGFRWWT